MLDMDILSLLDREVSWIQWLLPLWTKAKLKNTDLIGFLWLLRTPMTVQKLWRLEYGISKWVNFLREGPLPMALPGLDCWQGSVKEHNIQFYILLNKSSHLPYWESLSNSLEVRPVASSSIFIGRVLVCPRAILDTAAYTDNFLQQTKTTLTTHKYWHMSKNDSFFSDCSHV